MARSAWLLGFFVVSQMLAAPSSSAAQVTGIVFDADSVTLSNVRVTLLKDTTVMAEQRSDENGWFSFTREESVGVSGVRAQLIGYQSVIFVLSRPDQHVEIRLRPTTLIPPQNWRVQLAASVTVNAISAGAVTVEPSDVSGVISFPRVLEPGDPLTIELASHGSSSCTRPDRVVTTSDRDYLTIVVLDRVRTGECTADWAAFPREVNHRFDVIGEKVIRIIGLRDDRIIRVTVETRASGAR